MESVDFAELANPNMRRKCWASCRQPNLRDGKNSFMLLIYYS